MIRVKYISFGDKVIATDQYLIPSGRVIRIMITEKGSVFTVELYDVTDSRRYIVKDDIVSLLEAKKTAKKTLIKQGVIFGDEIRQSNS
jgi:hypothetical protein